jgi:hypothetical protein
MGHEVIIILTRKTRGRDWKLRDQRVGSERESFEKDSVCAAKALFSCPAIISQRLEPRIISNEPLENTEEESKII